MTQTQEELDAEAALYRLLCSAKEAAKLTHCSERTVYNRSRRFALRELSRRRIEPPPCSEIAQNNG